MRILSDRKGQSRLGTFSFPARPLRYHRLETDELILDLSPSWRPLFIQLAESWPDPLEWLKFTLSGRAVYYTALGYGDLATLFDQYYIPCPVDDPEARALLGPAQMEAARRAVSALAEMEEKGLGSKASGLACMEDMLEGLGGWRRLQAVGLERLLGCRVHVLPPDTMICDYDVFPLMISTGCLYNCGFCKVKDGTEFTARSEKEVSRQAEALAAVLGPELEGMRALFLGNQDGLNCPAGLIMYACEQASRLMPMLEACFVFASVDSFLRKPDSFFHELDSIGLDFYLNIGIESLDGAVLERLRKPVDGSAAQEAWEKMNHVNASYTRIEVSCNILWNEDFPRSHWDGLADRLAMDRASSLGALYLSPYRQAIGRPFFRQAKFLKRLTRRPVRIYNLVPL